MWALSAFCSLSVNFLCPGLKGLPGVSSNQVIFFLSVCLLSTRIDEINQVSNKKVTKYFTNILIEMLKPNSVASRLKWDAKLNIVIDDETWGGNK